MAKKKTTYNFGEKTKEWSSKRGQEIPTWKADKYEATKAAAIAIIEKYDDIDETDFWILKNETKTGKMAYSGIIISHNGCLKINDAAKEEDKFRPECIKIDKEGYGGSLVFIYNSPEQGIFEVGEVSPQNCKQNYPYAMALKRCMDRVILKISGIAFNGIYSESEADEFRKQQDDGAPPTPAAGAYPTPPPAQAGAPTDQPMAPGAVDYLMQIRQLAEEKGIPEIEICNMGGVTAIENMVEGQMVQCIYWLQSEPKRTIGGERGQSSNIV